MSEKIIVKPDDEQKDKLFDQLGDFLQEDLFPNSRLDREIGEHVDEFIITKNSKNEYNLKVKLTLNFTLEKEYSNYNPFMRILKSEWQYKEEKKEELKYDLEDILDMTTRFLTIDIKKYTNKKYSNNRGAILFDYINFLNDEGLLNEKTSFELENVYTNKKVFTKLLNDFTGSDTGEFERQYQNIIKK